MAIRKLEDGRYLVEIDRAGCKRVRKKFKDEASAEKFQREYLENSSISKNDNKSSATEAKWEWAEDNRQLSELIDMWYRYHGINLADHEHIRRQLDIICQNLENPIAAQMTAETWVDYRFRRMNAPEKPISGKTANNLHQYLNAVFTRLRKLKIIYYESPLAGIELIKIQERQLSYLTYEEIMALMNAIKVGCDNPSTWWVAQICIRTGARWGEAENLRRKQLHNGRITFEFTKSKKTRTIPIDQKFFSELMVYAKGKSAETRLFSSCIASFNRAVERAKLELPKGQCTHILRHSFASHFIMNGGNIFELKGILGHSDIRMTMRYAHLAPGYFEAATKLNPLASLSLG